MAILALIRKKKIMLRGVFFLFFSLLVSCSSNTTAPVSNVWNEVKTTQTRYTVQAGDTLYTIAWRFNLSDESLASWNQLSKPYALRVGEILRLRTPSSEPALYEPVQKTVAADSKAAKPAAQAIRHNAKPQSVSAKNVDTASHTDAPAVVSPVHTKAVQGTGDWPWPAQGKLLAPYGQNGNKGIDLALPIGTKIKAVQAGTVVYAGANLHGYGQLLIIKQKEDLITAYAHNSKLLVAEGAQITAGQVIALSGDSEAATPMLHFEVRKLGKTVDPLQYLS